MKLPYTANLTNGMMLFLLMVSEFSAVIGFVK